MRMTAFTRRIGFFRVCISHLFPYQKAKFHKGHPVTSTYFMTGDGVLQVGNYETDCMAGDFVELLPEMYGEEMIGSANDVGASWISFRKIEGHQHKVEVHRANQDLDFTAKEDCIIVSLFANLMINAQRHNVTEWRKLSAGQTVKIEGHDLAAFAVVVETDEGSDEILREDKS